jgi:hypothetical protein
MSKRVFTITVECELNKRHPGFEAVWGLTKWRLTTAIQDALERQRNTGLQMPAEKGSTIVIFE